MNVTKVFTAIGGVFGGIALLCATAVPAYALEGDNWWVGGYIKQGISLAYDLPGQPAKLGPANFVVDADASWTPNDNVAVTASFWLRGDWYPDIGGNIRQGGIQDFTSPGFQDQFGFNLNQQGGANYASLPTPFGASAGGMRTLSNFNNDMIREFSIKYTDPDGRFSFKIGKFQRGWGQSDGLRLMDVLNAQDFRVRAFLSDAQDSRIPAWMTSIDFNFENLGISKPFEAIGLKNTVFEFDFVPEIRHDQFVINNPTPSDASSGGLYGFPFPQLRDPVSGLGIPFIGVNLTDHTPSKFSVKDAEWAVRLKFNALDADWTLNGLIGQQELPVVKLTGSNLLIGSAFNDPSQAAAVVPLDVPTTLGAAWAPGQYFDFLRSLGNGTAAPGQFPLLPFGCNDPLVAAPNCSLTLNFNLDYAYRKKMVGFTMTKELSALQLGPKNVSPVLRTEFTYEFDKPFNKALNMTPFGAMETGTPILVVDPTQAIAKRDQWQLMVGLDYFLWLPFWHEQRSSIFTSVQFFNIHTNNHDNLFFQAPYSANGSLVHKDLNYVTFLWNVGLMHEKLFLEGLAISDLSNKGFAYRQRIDFNFFGDHIRPRLEWIHIGSQTEQGLLGLFKHSDIIETSLTIQF